MCTCKNEIGLIFIFYSVTLIGLCMASLWENRLDFSAEALLFVKIRNFPFGKFHHNELYTWLAPVT